MAISLVGTATGTDTVTAPAHQAGDVFLVFAFRDGSNTAPLLPSGLGYDFPVNTGGANTCSHRLAMKPCLSGSETVGTFTNATSLLLIVLRGVDLVSLFGAQNSSGGLSTVISYPALTLQRTDGTSWVFAFGGHRSANVAIETVPSGMTLTATVSDATDEAAAFRIQGPTSFTTRTASVGGTSSGWRSATVEIRERRATGTAALTDEDETVAAAGLLAAVASAGLADAHEFASGVAALAVSGSATILDGEEQVSGSVSTLVPVLATATLTDASDNISGQVAIAARASASLSDSAETVSSSGRAWIAGRATLSDASDAVSGAGRLPTAGAGSLIDVDGPLSAAAAVRIAGNALLQDAETDTLASGRGALAAAGGVVDADDGLGASGVALRSAAASLLDADDVFSAAGVVSNPPPPALRLTARAPEVLRLRARAPDPSPLLARASVLRLRARAPDDAPLVARAPRPIRFVARAPS